ncbi:MAG: hypothetical protein OHK0015_04740 [Chloroflexi bacterium OHK40]
MTMLPEILGRLGPADQLMVAGARARLDSAAAERVRALAGADVDWRRLIAIANGSKVLPLVGRNLLATAGSALPPEVAQALRTAVVMVTQQNLLLTGELLRVLRLLDEHSIPAFPFKGPALAAQVYGDLSLRQFGDLDVWIRPEDFLRARELVMASGYVPYLPPPDDILPVYTGTHHEYGFMRDDDAVHLELLWRVVERPFAFPRKLDEFWQRLVPISLLGRKVLSLAPEPLLICLCVHGSKHLWSRLSWVCDVAEAVRVSEGLDWQRLLATAEEHGAGRMVRLGLYLAGKMLEAPVPATVLRRAAADREVQWLAGMVGELIFEHGHMPDEVFNTLHLYHMRMLNRLGDRMQVVRRYAYSVLNPLHVYRKYGIGPLKHLIGR